MYLAQPEDKADEEQAEGDGCGPLRLAVAREQHCTLSRRSAPKANGAAYRGSRASRRAIIAWLMFLEILETPSELPVVDHDNYDK